MTPERIEKAEQFGIELNRLVNETEVLASDKNRAAGAAFFIAQDHRHAIVFLLKNTFYSSSLALLRSLFEAYLRGLWLKYCATDIQVKEFIAGGEPPNTVIAEIEAIPGFQEKILSRIKKDVWKTMCAYTHTGGLHLLQWQTPGGVEPNFDADDLEECLNCAELFGAMSALEFVQMSKAGNTGESVFKLMTKRWPGVKE
ncbi:MAG: DUF6988 family protein [Candidatus Saccharimonadales bacterium]